MVMATMMAIMMMTMMMAMSTSTRAPDPCNSVSFEGDSRAGGLAAAKDVLRLFCLSWIAYT